MNAPYRGDRRIGKSIENISRPERFHSELEFLGTEPCIGWVNDYPFSNKLMADSGKLFIVRAGITGNWVATSSFSGAEIVCIGPAFDLPYGVNASGRKEDSAPSDPVSVTLLEHGDAALLDRVCRETIQIFDRRM